MTKEDILTRISQEEIMERYLGVRVSGRKIKNPLRSDKNPGCTFFRSASGILYFNDFAWGKKWNCFDVVMEIYGCSFPQCLKIINQDFGLELDTKYPKPPRLEIKKLDPVEKHFDVVIGKWTRDKLQYWKDYGISAKTLKLYKVVPIDYLITGSYVKETNELAFAYMEHFPYLKVYRPEQDKKNKWRSNTTSNLLHGSSALKEKGDLLILTKSLKDVMVLREMGYESISPMAESIILEEYIVKDLKERFDKIVVLFDNDGEFHPKEPGAGKGKEATLKTCRKHDLPFILVQGTEKDISDYVKAHGIQEGKKHIKWLLEDQLMTISDLAMK